MRKTTDPQRIRSRGRELLVNLFLALLGAISPLVVLEAGMRLYHAYVKVHSEYQPAVNERRIFDRKPHANPEINAWGFRDREYTRQKPSNVYRIVVLGDSVTHGYGVGFEERYTKRLEALLNQKERKYEVIVLGMNQYSTVQEIEVLKDIGLGLNPDLVILAYVLNDPTADGSTTDFFRRDRARWLAVDWVAETARPVLCGTEPPRNLQGCQPFDYYSNMHCDAAKWAAVQAALEELRGLSRRHAFPVLLVVFPVFEDRTDASFADYPWRAVHVQVIDEAARNEFFSLDLLPYFAQRGVLEVKLAAGDRLHPNPLGHEIAANAIYSKLLSLGVANAP